MADDFDFGDNVDMNTFEQVLEMDEEDSHEFSWEIVEGFWEQAETTFKEMHTETANGDLPKLSSLGHYLKGSSATLGFIKLKDECEKIQNYGNMKDATGERDQTDADLALSKIQESVANAEKHYKVVKPLMISYYQKLGVE